MEQWLDRILNKYLPKIELTTLPSLLLSSACVRHSCDLHGDVPPKMPRPNAQSLGIHLMSKEDFEDVANGPEMEGVRRDTCCDHQGPCKEAGGQRASTIWKQR